MGRPTELPKLHRSSEGHLWTESAIEEWARLSQGHRQTKGLDAVWPVHKCDLPKGAKVTAFALGQLRQAGL
jgi:hypothetical protein